MEEIQEAQLKKQKEDDEDEEEKTGEADEKLARDTEPDEHMSGYLAKTE